MSTHFPTFIEVKFYWNHQHNHSELLKWFNQGTTGHFLHFETKWLGQDGEHWLEVQHDSHISCFLALYRNPTNGSSPTGAGEIWSGATGGGIGKRRIKGTPPPTAGLWVFKPFQYSSLMLSCPLNTSMPCVVLGGNPQGINNSRAIKTESKRNILLQEQKDNYRM